MTIVHVGNAIGAFQGTAFRSDNSPLDRYVRGDKKALSKNATTGMQLLYGKAGCSNCHGGLFQTNHNFHAIGMPQVGPGFGGGEFGYEDSGREGFSGDSNDRYRFRAPSLRNVFLTGAWGHDGFFKSLEAVVRYHMNRLE